MLDYPKTQGEFEALVASEASCRTYLTAIRWPNGFVCPQCGATATWVLPREVWACRACGRKTSVTAGTLFHDSRLPLHRWFSAIWYVVGQKSGASALGVQRLLGLGSYHTAWAWLHRLRRAMVRPGRDLLTGTVEVDETFWGCAQPGRPGRSPGRKTLIFVAVAHDGETLQRIRLLRIPDASGSSLLTAVRACIAPGSTVETDGWVGYHPLSAAGYNHQQVRATDSADAAPLPRVHLIASLLKRWLLGTHQGGIQATHLDYYLDEYTFRFNRRTSHSRGLLFRRVLEYAVLHPPLREVDLRAPSAEHSDPRI